MSRHESFINRAVGVALTSTCRQRHGAVITHGSRVVAYAPNTNRNDPATIDTGASWHAEEAAFRKLDRANSYHYDLPSEYKGHAIYIARVNSKNEPKMSRPCKKCFEWIVYKGIYEIFYTNELGHLSHEVVQW